MNRNYLEDVDCNGDSDEREQDQCKHGAIGVHHAVVLGASSATPEKGNDEHDASDDDQNDRGVEVSVAQEIQVLLHVDLDVSSNSDESDARQKEDEVEQEDNVAYHAIAAPHFAKDLKNIRLYFISRFTFQS